MRTLNLILVLLFMTTASCIKDVSGVENITVEDLKIIIEKEKDIQLLDVRLPSECENGTILNAMQVNLISDNFKTRAIKILDKERPVYVYCRSGGRSKIASKVLLDKGYVVYNVKGGYKRWLEINKKK